MFVGNGDLSLYFYIFIAEQLNSPTSVGLKQAFAFNNTRFRTGHCTDGTTFQKAFVIHSHFQ
jgi:hypothetical protein